MTDKPHMTLPNGDKLYEGDYGRTRDGRKVGPMKFNNQRAPFDWKCGEGHTYTEWGSYLGECHPRDIIAKWTEAPAQPEAPKLWRDMTPEEKGALLLAHHEGRAIEFCINESGDWQQILDPSWCDVHAYRIRPEPKRETVAICYRAPHGQWREIGTIDLIDGKPDLASIRMDEINV